MRRKTLSGTVRSLVLPAVVGLTAAIAAANPSNAIAQFAAPGMPSMPSATFGGSFGSPSSRQLNMPVVSPYLNLLQPGLDPAITYQTMIRPEIQFRSALVEQGQMIQDLQRGGTGTSGRPGAAQPMTQPLAPQFRQTGHATAFLNTSTYFPGMHIPQRRR
jgi:hypothetical protein